MVRVDRLGKTTLQIDDSLLDKAKQRAAAAGVSLRAWVEDALRARLLPTARRRERFRLDLSVVRGTAPPRVDVADRNALYDLLDRA